MKIKDFKGKKCIITGAASGIGKSTAIKMGELGVNLFLTDINATGLKEVSEIIEKNGGIVSKYKALDISNYEDVKSFAEEIHKEFGAMDIIMNIAGISLWGEIHNLEHKHWQKCINVDLWGPIHVMECFLKETIKAGNGGHLVNVSSSAGLFGLPIHAPYSAAKAGLVGISEVIRFDLERYNIGVTLVCPGAVKTPLVDTLEVIGIDRTDPAALEIQDRFLERAITPDKAAEQIIRAIKKNKYLVLTSMDMKALHWLKRKMAPLYRLIMRKLNKMLDKVK
ncbi:MAG: SDR family oxidoreductase [Candidatus Helarchaeota archaeon]